MKLPNIIKNRFKCWVTTKSLIERMDIILSLIWNYRPIGSRSKGNIMVVKQLSGAMKWGIRDAGRGFAKKILRPLNNI